MVNSVSEIDKQNQVFKQAYESGQISKTEYAYAMKVQSQNRAEALAREQAQQEAQTPNTNYWTKTSTPETIGKNNLPSANAQKIEAPEGYTIQNIRPVNVVEHETPNTDYWTQPSKQSTVPEATGQAIAYDLVKTPEPVKQQDIGIAEQFRVGLNVFGQVAPSLIESQFGKDTPASKIAKLEFENVIFPANQFAAGSTATLEKVVYSTAGLIGSAKVSLETRQLQYVPGFEGLDKNIKTPILAPTFSDSLINTALGDNQDAIKFSRQPLAYQLGAGFSEVGLAVLEGEGLGFALGKTGTVFKTVINPKVNQIAESTLARSKLNTETFLGKMQPGLGKATTNVLSKDLASVRTIFDKTELKISQKVGSKLVDPFNVAVKTPILKTTNTLKTKAVTKLKYDVADPLINKGLSVRNDFITIGQVSKESITVPKFKVPKISNNELSMYSRSVIQPNIGNYEKLLQLDKLENLATPIRSTATKIKAPVNTAKMISKQILEAQPKTRITQKAITSNPIKRFNAQVKQVFTAQPKQTTKVIKSKAMRNIEKSILGTETRGTSKSVTKTPRGFVKESKPIQQQVTQMEKQISKTTQQQGIIIPKAFTLPYPGTQKRRTVIEETEIAYIPTQRLTPQNRNTQNNRFIINTGINPQFDNLVNTVGTADPTIKLKIEDSIFPTPITIIDQRPKITPNTFIDTKPKQIPDYTPQLIIPQPVPPTNSRQKIKFGKFDFGGGGGFGFGVRPLKGRWRKVNNPIKSPEQVLASIGVKTPKNLKRGLNSIDFSINKMTAKQKAKSKRRKR